MSRSGAKATRKLGTRCEIKNLNSFRFMQQAIEFEVRRQIELIDDGGTVVQETRLFDPDRGETRPMRSKEDAQDYRYFPDPDLPPLAIEDAWIERVKIRDARIAGGDEGALRRRLRVAAARRRGADRGSRDRGYFETAVKSLGGNVERNGKLVANWILGELAAALNRDNRAIAAAPVRAEALAALLRRVADGTISGKIGKDVFDAMWAGEHGGDADAIIAAKGLKQISDAGAIESDRRRRAGRPRRDRRRIPRGQGEGVSVARRQGDGRNEGQSRSRAGECNAAPQALHLNGGNDHEPRLGSAFILPILLCTCLAVAQRSCSCRGGRGRRREGAREQVAPAKG